jgi:hypothetical protein
MWVQFVDTTMEAEKFTGLLHPLQSFIAFEKHLGP